jgi:nucleoside-diphosphate-sugar epimerase
MSQKILVTGATGFIASHCIIDLLEHGYSVRGSVRNMQRADQLREILARHTDKISELDFAEAELTDPAGWSAAVDGCDGVFHVASPVPFEQPEDPDEIIVPAREGTLNVLRAARDAKIKRVVLTSSVAAIASNEDQYKRSLTGEDWTDVKRPNLTPYILSKTYAEKAAWNFVGEPKTPELATVNPALVLGPALEADYRTSLEVRTKLLEGAYPMLPKLSMGVVDVRDVAILHRLVYEHPLAAGHRFIASNGEMWLREMSLFLRDEFPEFRKKLPKRELPNFGTRVLARFDKVIADFVDELGKVTKYDIGPAQSIGWQPRSKQEALRDGAKSLIEFGVVKS